jgi:HlyD family secretion protein
MSQDIGGAVARDTTAAKPAKTRSKRRVLLPAALLLLLLAAGGAAYWRLSHPPAAATSVTVFGTIDIRQTQVAFNDSDRIAHLYFHEGDRVTRGQLLGDLDETRLKANADKADADVETADKTLTRLLDGSRPEEIAEARAALAAAVATEANARINLARYNTLSPSGAETKQNRDNAEQSLKVAAANRDAAEQALALALEGPRWEDIAVARAQLASAKAAAAYAHRQYEDAKLLAPANGMIEDRILEPGDMVTPQTPVYTLDLDDPVYARAYLPEHELGKIRTGMRAWIETDAYPGEKFPAWIGFIATTAEFTPKTVETTDLRTALVYRLHVYACNPGGRLRLGAPVTVIIPLEDNAPGGQAATPCESGNGR